MYRNNISLEYENGHTLQRRSIILDYIFAHSDEYVQPKKLRKEYQIDSKKFTKDLSRHFYWLYEKWVIFSKNDIEQNPTETKVYNTAYKLNNEDIKFKIPLSPLERFNYASFIISLLMADSTKNIVNNPLITILNEKIIFSFKSIFDGLIRESILASEIYDYYNYGDNTLFSILSDIVHFKQKVDITIKTNEQQTSIKNTHIKSIELDSSKNIILHLEKISIFLSSLDEIVNLYIISNAKIKTLGYEIPKLNRNDLVNVVKTHPGYNKFKEIFLVFIEEYKSESDDEVIIEIDDYINNYFSNKKFPNDLDRDKMSQKEILKEGKVFTERVKKHLRIRKDS